jgi:hypothetical protein
MNKEDKAIVYATYKKANRMLDGEVPLDMGSFSIDELKMFLVTCGGIGEKFKEMAVNEIIEKTKNKAYEYYRDMSIDSKIS